MVLGRLKNSATGLCRFLYPAGMSDTRILISSPRNKGGRPKGSKDRVKRFRRPVASIRVGSINCNGNDLAAAGQQLDMIGLFRGLQGAVCERLLKELEDADASRMASLRELVTALHNLEIDHIRYAGAAARDITPASSNGSPMPFRIDAFERRKEVEPRS